MINATMSGLNAKAREVIKLNEPDMSRPVTMMQAFAQRHSERAFAPEMLTNQDLSDLLWAADGINRPDGHRTAPSGMNAHDVDIYLLTAEGAYLFNPAEKCLTLMAEGDHRALIRGPQPDFPLPAVAFVMTTTPSRFNFPDAHLAEVMGNVDAGIISQNISLFCGGAGLANVPRVSMDYPGLAALLRLPAGTTPVINNCVGYPAR